MLRTSAPFRTGPFARLALVIALVAGPALAQEDPARADRVLSIGGSVTEIVYALGEEDRLVGRDTTSTWPAAAEELPDVGYLRALSPEGILSVDPDLIIAEEDSGPPETVAVMDEAGIPFVAIPGGHDAAAVRAKIVAVADALGVAEAGQELADDIDAQFAALDSAAQGAAMDGVSGEPARVLFVLSLEGGRIMAAGANTSAEGIITLAGGTNALTGFEGYKPVTDEAVSAAAPDVILMMDRGGDHGVADDVLWSLPAFAATPAAASRSVVRLDGLLLLGFGPRTPEAVAALNSALYPATP